MAKRTITGSQPKEALLGFLPCVAAWFNRTFAAPSPAQVLAWPAIRRGENTLLLAPTGSGKTLAAFLGAIDELYRKGDGGALTDTIHVLYVTPLKALGNDVHRNLLVPLQEIQKGSRKKLPEIRVAVRTGDTPPAERQRMVRRPPHILITTPESLYLLLQSGRMRPALRSIRTVIVDEIHALCDNKRGVHLAVSLERLQEFVAGPLQRVGCSATLNPIEQIAAFLVGYDGNGQRRPCTILNAGMRKDLDVQVAAPLPDFLAAGNQALWASAYELLLREIAGHRTTLIFCNSRYKAERTALHLGELAGAKSRIGVHHGSMAKEIRLRMEDELKAGQLDALVATSSLELGIDIGSVDLVYQLESPKSIATGLQRVGRAGHLLGATSKGRMLVFDRDELCEAAAICRAMVAGELDAVALPRGCLDVLAQQIVGSVAARDWDDADLFRLIRQAYPYTGLSRADYDAVLRMLSGEHPFQMARPPAALVLWDRATGRLTAARGTASTSAMCVGTISESSEYEVVIERNNRRIGKIHAEFVDDSLRTGDVFVLGSSSWKVRGKKRDRVLVEEAPGSTPTVPWWTGPVEPRTPEVGVKIGGLRQQIARGLDDPGLPNRLQHDYHLSPDAASVLIDYVREQKLASGMVPDHERLLVESWRDELGRPNIIIHCPFGQRVNRTWGLAIAAAAKKHFRQKWALTASNDLLLLTLAGDAPGGKRPTDAASMLARVAPRSVGALIAADGEADALGGTAFREAAVCALQIPRVRRGARVPVWIQNYRAEELCQAALRCAEYPVVAEVRRSYVEKALDAGATERLLADIRTGAVGLEFRDVESPSPFAHGLLIQDMYRGDHKMGRERRAHLLRLHRQMLQDVLSDEQIAQLLDPRAIERLERQLLHVSENRKARSSEELGQIIRELGDVPARMEAVQEICEGPAEELLARLLRSHSVVAAEIPGCEQDPWRLVPADLWRLYRDAFGRDAPERSPTVLLPRIRKGQIVGFDKRNAGAVIPSKWTKGTPKQRARESVVERYLKCRGPVTLYDLMDLTGWPAGAVEAVVNRLVESGSVARGVYRGDKPRPQWVNKINLEEIHRLTMGYLKRELAACAPYEVVDFLTRWQHRHPATRVRGPDGLREVIGQLQGFEVLQGYLEPEVLAGRVEDYRPEMLEALIASGEVCWCRVDPACVRRGRISLCFRADREWLGRGSPVAFNGPKVVDRDIPDVVSAVQQYLRENKTAFFDDIVRDTGLDDGFVMRAVWCLAWRGEATCETYECLRQAKFTATLSEFYDLGTGYGRVHRAATAEARAVGQREILDRMWKRKLDPRLARWSATERLAQPKRPLPAGDVARRWAEQLLKRWGIVSRDIVDGEAAAPSWASLVLEFKRLELLGRVSRGYFIESHHGEQYGLPAAIELLRECRARRSDRTALGYLPDEPVFWMTNQDPANLYSTCLDVIEERGAPLKVAQRSGNVQHRMIIQAGQVLLFAGTWDIVQLAALTPRQLRNCLEQLRAGPVGAEQQLQVRDWNHKPIEGSRVASLLGDLGFRYDGKRALRWPVRGTGEQPPAAPLPEEFVPYYLDSSQASYDRTWVIARATEAVSPKLRALFDLLERLPPARKEFVYHPYGVDVRYRGRRYGGFHAQRKKINLHITHKGWVPPIHIMPDTDLEAPEFVLNVRTRIEHTCHTIDQELAKQPTRQATKADRDTVAL